MKYRGEFGNSVRSPCLKMASNRDGVRLWNWLLHLSFDVVSIPIKGVTVYAPATLKALYTR
jgi:hypothetical protein